MLISLQEQELCRHLCDLPRRHDYDYTERATRELHQILFRSLAGRSDYLTLFFPQGPPTGTDVAWSLREAQGAIDGVEYTAAARGKPCGHIFKVGEASYRCKTCTAEDTCVLCARCFDASDHEGHQVFVSVSPGNSGCCDCGDDEAWVRPVHCNIHSASSLPGSKSAGKAKEGSSLPDELLESIRMTISRALDYLIDVFSCSPEQLRLPKTEESILEDERSSRLTSKWYGPGDVLEVNQKFALVLWNDEKHTVNDVQAQVARACKQKLAFGLAKAHEVDAIGRSAIVYRSDIKELLRMAKIIEDIKLTVTIRSARDTFREQMGGAIIDWIVDISACSVGNDTHVLRRIVCEELLKPWRVGSEASHQSIGKDGLDDQELDDKEAEMNSFLYEHMGAARRAQVARQQRERANRANNEPNAGSDGDEDGERESTEDAAEDMDIDDILDQDNDGDVDMEAYESTDEALEVSEATIAGYPPPPPPPQQGPRRNNHNLTPTESDSETMLPAPSHSHVEPSMHVPETPRTKALPLRPSRPLKYWLEKPDGYGKKLGIPTHEDLWVRLRLDHLILYDLRMWKKLRIGVRDVFISTVVTIPQFKRLLGLRFAGVYTALAQLYLIADREPDHSIINLSLQMLTTPSITAEIVERGNFLTNLMAILYTFLTTRQVGYPWNVDPKATLAFEQGAVTNRRMYHFFLDMKCLLGSTHVQERIREEERYLLQFLDLVKLHQGICPNVRAVGEHLEYETEAWISASLITREINKLCRQFSESFVWARDDDPTNICRAIRSAAKVTIINSLGAERKRFDQAELKSETRFKGLNVLEFDAQASTYEGPSYRIVDYIVAKEPMSFHHALHYTLSWLIDRGRSMPQKHLRELLLFEHAELQESHAQLNVNVPFHSPDDYLLALFDFPLRVCAWLSQMRAGIWVRNGITLRHQMTQYRSVSQRDVSYQRDIFLLQAALVICHPSVFLATMVDRFGLLGWMSGKYEAAHHGFEDSQAIEVVEDFVHLLIILLSDRTSLVPLEDDADSHVSAMRRDIAHILCFKPLPFSELNTRLSDRIQNLDEFSDVLEEMTQFKPPEGLSDTGTFELKEQYIELIDPYIHQYTRNQREEAEIIYKKHMAKKTGKQVGDIVFEPKLRQITSGLFQNLTEFTRQPMFTQIIYYLLGYALVAPTTLPNLPETRVESYIQFVLQLLLVAILEDRSEQHEWSQEMPDSLVTSVLTKRANFGIPDHPTVLSILKTLLEKEAFKTCEPKIMLILHRLKQRQQSTFIVATEALNMSNVRLDTASPAAITLQERELKKKQALDRQARVMASFKEQQGKFMANQHFDWGEDDFSDLEDGTDTPAIEQEKIIKYPSGTCILCQEETNEQRLYGTFGYVSESSILRQTDVNDDEWVDEVTHTPINLDRSADSIRPFGVAGKNRRMVEKTSSTGERVLTERQDLGRGFPCSQTKRGPVSTGCGHIMHYTCFEVYLQATQRRHVSQIARNHPERPECKEFMCPLCKALGNMFLPIIWKGQKVKYPGALQTQSTFDNWIDSELAFSISKFDKSPERAVGEQPTNQIRLHKAFLDYGQEEFIQPVAIRLPDIVKSTFATMHVPQPRPQPHFHIPAQIPAFLNVQNDEPRDPMILTSEGSSSSGSQTIQIQELFRVYQRLRETFTANKIESEADRQQSDSANGEDLTHAHSIARALGYSISAVEIAQRGIQSESMRGTLIDKISPQSLTHLRVYSETVSSYVAIGSLRNQGLTKTMDDYKDTQYRQLHQLFIGHPNLFDPDTLGYDLKAIPPLLLQDPFIFLTECATCVVPALGLDVHHVLRLCYLAEMVRVVLTFSADNNGRHYEPYGDIKLEDITLSDETSTEGRCRDPERFANTEKVKYGNFDQERWDNLLVFVSLIFYVANLGDSPASTELEEIPIPDRFKDAKFLYFIYTMASTYALPFVRKAAILMHVRYGVELPHVPFENVEEPELDRLSSLLKLPSLHEMFASFSSRSAGGYATRLVVGGWIRHWMWAREGKRPLQASISLSHPAIFELVGLPRNYDTLIDEAIRRKCPTTGKEMTDPCICLFCGEIMCSQAVCCMTADNRGSCNKHQAK